MFSAHLCLKKKLCFKSSMEESKMCDLLKALQKSTPWIPDESMWKSMVVLNIYINLMSRTTWNVVSILVL